jgi:hypothetical protein
MVNANADGLFPNTNKQKQIRLMMLMTEHELKATHCISDSFNSNRKNMELIAVTMSIKAARTIPELF